MMRSDFEKQMARLAGIFPNSFPDDLSGYWETIGDRESDDLENAVSAMIRNREKTTFPRPAEIMTAIAQVAGRRLMAEPSGNDWSAQVRAMRDWNAMGYQPPFTEKDFEMWSDANLQTAKTRTFDTTKTTEDLRRVRG